MNTLLAKLRAVFRRKNLEAEMAEEMRQHLDRRAQEKLADGLTPDEARYAAQREFGGIAQVQEHCRDERRFVWIEQWFQDVRYGARSLRKSPGFSAVVVLTLALGIGANTAIFTLLSKVLIRPLPVEAPEQLVAFVDPKGVPAAFSFPTYADLRERVDVLSGLVAYFQQPFHLSSGGQTERVVGRLVSGNYFGMLGIRPALGRFFSTEEDKTPGTHPVVVISHGLWRRRFAADPLVIGTTARLNGHVYTIIGITPAEFTGTTRGTVNEVYVPVMMQQQAQPANGSQLGNRNAGWLHLLGRLQPNFGRSQAQAALAQSVENAPTSGADKVVDPTKILLVDGSRGHMDRIKDLTAPLKMLMGVVGFVLLIACANVANLLLTRAANRRREIAVRMAIGAGRLRIVRQLLTESAILATLGGGAALLVASWCTRLLLGFEPQTNFVPRALNANLDGSVLGFTLGLSMLTGIIFGLLPALQASKLDFVAALKDDTPGLGGGQRRWSVRNLLVVAQVALSLVVLIGAGLCVKSLRALQAIDPGFDAAKVVTASFNLNLNSYDEVRGRDFIARLSERVAALPGVEAVSFARIPAFSDLAWRSGATIDGYQPQPGERLVFDLNFVSPGYFRTLGSHLAQGREFTTHDSVGAPRVIVVNEALARRYWPGQDAVGKQTNRGEVVGVVRNSRDKGLITEPRPAIYSPLLQNYMAELTLHVRSATEPQMLVAGLRREAHALDPTLPLYNVQTLSAQRDGSIYTQRLAATLLTWFAVLALVLAAIGLYGVLSYVVTNSTREMGIRIALGAQRGNLLKLVIGHGMLLALIGLAIGVAASFALTRLIQKMLFGVSATDPMTFTLIPAVLAAVAFVACWLPARRATKVNPIVALRCE